MEELPQHELHFPLDPNESWFRQHELEVAVVICVFVITPISVFVFYNAALAFQTWIRTTATENIYLLLGFEWLIVFGLVMRRLGGIE